MKYISIILLFILFSCNVEQRITENSYTEYWYYENNVKYQVYKTNNDRYYIIILNKNQNNLKRKYIKL